MKNNYIDLSNVQMPNGLSKIDINNIPDTFEISISLFTQCNLNCKFCFEQIKTKLDPNIFNLIFDNFINILDQIKLYNIKNIKVNFLGGQLFNDIYDEQHFLFYQKIINKINQQTAKYNFFTVKYNFMSNGIFKRYERVNDFLNKVNSQISFSYDPVGRYLTNWQLDLLKFNIEFFKQRMPGLSLTLTKPNIEYILANNDDLINNNIIDVNYYFPNKNWQENLPSDKLLYDFFYWGVTNKKTNIILIQNIIDSYFNMYDSRGCNCKFAIQFINNQWTKNCVKRFTSSNPQHFYGNYLKYINQNNCTQVKNTLALMKRGCVYCENYSKCLMLCFCVQLFKNYYIDMNFCPIKQIYNYIEKHETEYI